MRSHSFIHTNLKSVQFFVAHQSKQCCTYLSKRKPTRLRFLKLRSMITTARVSSECNANIISYFFRSKSASKNRDSQSQKKEGTKNANKQKN